MKADSPLFSGIVFKSQNTEKYFVENSLTQNGHFWNFRIVPRWDFSSSDIPNSYLLQRAFYQIRRYAEHRFIVSVFLSMFFLDFAFKIMHCNCFLLCCLSILS